MRLRDIKDIFWQELQPYYPREEVNSFFYQLVEHYLGVERFILVLDPGYQISKEEEQPLFEALAQLRQEIPIQYILGKACFMELAFHVNKQVLIPRPETEELVRWILDDRREMTVSPAILDIGTGSGCIAISLAKYWPAAKVSALDVSVAALETAKENARQNSVAVSFILADILVDFETESNWDIIVSNPPYVRQSEKRSMSNNVKLYEPDTALFVPDDSPLLFYEQIARIAAGNLKAGGALYLEINQNLASETWNLLQSHNFFEIELRKDMFGNDRMLRAKLPH